MGGRGALSRAKGKLRKLFFGNPGKSEPSTELFPSRMNIHENVGSLERMIEGFTKRHDKEKLEYAVTVDEYGFATSYYEGSTGSVNVPSNKSEGMGIVHNHPENGWANFSGGDLKTWAEGGSKSITAVSRNVAIPQRKDPYIQEAYRNRRAGKYTIEKTHHFDSEGFMKAIRKIELRDTHYDYDLDQWLKKNQKKYGYKYSYKKAKNKVD